MSNLNIPELTEGTDEVVIELVLRRTDQPNVGGGAGGDMGASFEAVPPQEVVEAVSAIVAAYGFDPAQSYVGITSVTEVEGASDAATLEQLQQVCSGS